LESPNFSIFILELLEFQENILAVFYPEVKGLNAVVLASDVRKTKDVHIQYAYIYLIPPFSMWYPCPQQCLTSRNPVFLERETKKQFCRKRLSLLKRLSL